MLVQARHIRVSHRCSELARLLFYACSTQTLEAPVAAQTGHDTFDALALPHLGALYQAALRYCRNAAAAEDLVQETMLRGYQCWHQFDPTTNCKAWLFRILSNSFINGWRRKTKEREVLEVEYHGDNGARFFCRDSANDATDPEKCFLQRHLSTPVIMALQKLKPEFRAVVELSDLQGFSYKEVAEVLDIPVGTVMSRLFRARQALKLELSSHAREFGLTLAEAAA
jgi:RNA polymerase sigma-70 factor (ECF subfamily)